ncbi:lipoprotein, partial [mine drainage metagenome]
MTNLPMLRLEWGIDGLKSAIKRKDIVVIIDQIRFSCAVVTAVALGFTIEPTSDKARKTESFSLSPSTFFNRQPQRVVIASSNGSYLSINAKEGKQVVYGCILNARAVAEWLDESNENTTLLAAGEIDV